MTNDIKYANSLAEVLYYLQGIKKEYVNKIPISFMKFLAENATKQYQCKFDYKKKLSEIEISDDAKGIIGLIALNYWCDNKEQKKALLEKWDENAKRQIEKTYSIQGKIAKNETSYYDQETEKRRSHIQKYSIQGKKGIGKHQLETNKTRKEKNDIQSLALKPYKQSLITKIFNKLNRLFKK